MVVGTSGHRHFMFNKKFEVNILANIINLQIKSGQFISKSSAVFLLMADLECDIHNFFADLDNFENYS